MPNDEDGSQGFRMKNGWLLAALLVSPSVLACINTVGTDRSGHRFMPGWYAGDALVEHLTWTGNTHYRQFLDEDSLRLAKAVRIEPDFRNHNDLGVNLIRQGRMVEAIRLFVAIEKRFPARPETAANLGTALELLGSNEIALRWIRIGIQRNAAEHEGTEWLHARILEAKIALKHDPRYLDNRSVAGVRFDGAVLPGLPKAYPPGNDGRPVSAHALNMALSYQLHERMMFVKPKDAIVANLLTDWATLNLAGGPVESAEALYPLAERYGAPRTPLVTARLAEIRRILASAKRRPDGPLGRCLICEPIAEPPPPPPEPDSPSRRPGEPLPPPPPPPPPPRQYRQ